ncbi:MAG TPA: lipase family protein [Acidimicrobiales bacterium]|nr:lipase family protein [Acidimicrobiales bacterium]
MQGRIGRLAFWLVVLGVLAAPAASAPTQAAQGPPVPSRDPFYRYSGARPLGQLAPGTVLKERSVKVAFGPGNSTPLTAEQLLYRTTGQLGQPTATVTTVLSPPSAGVLPRIVGYLSFYDGLGPRCDPSYTLAGGDAGDSTYQQEADEEQLLISWYLSQGDIVTVPDFEGTGLDWMAGRESGYGTLDAVRATESYLRVGSSTKVGLSGYSGGAVAADWASELAPAYAPQVNLVGVAEGGVPANYLDHFAYINGTGEYSAAIPGELLGLTRAYHVDLGPYLSSFGRKVVEQESDACMASEFGRYPGLTISQLMLPAYRDLGRVAPFSSMLSQQTMGTAKTHPREPLLIGVGNVDGRGDGAMVAADDKALARHYCREGIAVDYQEYTGASHTEAGAFFEPQTGPFLQQRFADVPFVGNCGSLGS